VSAQQSQIDELRRVLAEQRKLLDSVIGAQAATAAARALSPASTFIAADSSLNLFYVKIRYSLPGAAPVQQTGR